MILNSARLADTDAKFRKSFAEKTVCVRRKIPRGKCPPEPSRPPIALYCFMDCKVVIKIVY